MEERARLEREEHSAAAKERLQLYRNPRAIAELKASEAPMPLTHEQRRSASRRRHAEQEKLRRYADGMPVESEDSGRPPPLPGAPGPGARVRRSSRKPEKEKAAKRDKRTPPNCSKLGQSHIIPSNPFKRASAPPACFFLKILFFRILSSAQAERGRLSPSSSLQTGCSETESALEPLEEPPQTPEAPVEIPVETPAEVPLEAQAPPVPADEAKESKESEAIEERAVSCGISGGKVGEVQVPPEELVQPAEDLLEPLEPEDLEEIEVESNLSISLHIKI